MKDIIFYKDKMGINKEVMDFVSIMYE